MRPKNQLWYQTPAKEWIAALPIGNGRMGAMVFGGTAEEKIQIDESSFWSGAPSDDNNRPGTKELMDQIRQDLLQGNYESADRLGHGFVGNKNQYGTNMPVGELKLKILGSKEKETWSGYERYLKLDQGIAGTKFQMEGIDFFRECFLSNPAQVFCMQMKAQDFFDLEIRYDGIGNSTALSGFDGTHGWIQGEARETLHSDGKHGVNLNGCIRVLTDGKQEFQGESLLVYHAKRIEVFLDLETTMFMEDPQEMARNRADAAANKGYESLKKEQIEDVGRLYQRMEISLGGEENCEIPTDLRIQKVASGEDDPDLYALMYQYGRYLLIASSREDSPLPTHMGGIWNDNIYNNIDCTQDMHIDMNLQMQYWAAAQVNLPECYRPFFRYLETVLIPSGKKTAKEAYHSDGWTAHVVSNPWGFTSLGWGYNWGVFSLGGAWCAVMVWDYYEYTQDIKFLREEGYSILEGAARFVLDYVFWDEKAGCFMTGPSYSPENQFSVNGKNYFLALSNTCDVILVRELLEVYLKAGEAVRKEEPSAVRETMEEEAKKVLRKLPVYQIGKYGQLQEWYHDFEEPIPNHRHTSHLLGLYPFWQITPERNPDYCRAARVSIERRLNQFEITSWGMNMLLGYYARLKDGKGAAHMIRDIFKKIVRTNMASVMDDEKSMWRGTWELDGNTGFTATMSELFVQSCDDQIQLLPALPEEWKDGYLKGISVKNAGQMDLYWENGSLTEAVFKPGKDGICSISYQNQILEREFKAGETVRMNGKLKEK